MSDWEYDGDDNDYYSDYEDYIDQNVFDRWMSVLIRSRLSTQGQTGRGQTEKTYKGVHVVQGSKPTPPFQIPSLVDISSRLVALSFPFAYVEHRNPPIPDELQLKIISFSFPDKEEIIQKWAQFSQVSISEPQQLCALGCVRDLTQIGRLLRYPSKLLVYLSDHVHG